MKLLANDTSRWIITMDDRVFCKPDGGQWGESTQDGIPADVVPVLLDPFTTLEEMNLPKEIVEAENAAYDDDDEL